jgi:hypothetical protein
LIPQRDISLLSNRLAAGGALRIREDVLERDYCFAWFSKRAGGIGSAARSGIQRGQRTEALLLCRYTGPLPVNSNELHFRGSNQDLSEIGVDPRVAVLVGVRQRVARNLSSEAHMIELGLLGTP